MYRFFDKHGKKVLAVAGVLLMLAFLLPSNFLHTLGGGVTEPMIAGKPLDPAAVDNDASAFQLLNQLVLESPYGQYGPPEDSFGNILFGRQVMQTFAQDKITWHLLAHEARESGVMPDDRQVESAVTELKLVDPKTGGAPKAIGQLNDAAQTYVKANVRLYLAIYGNFQRTQQTRKISQPLVDDAIALTTQSARARLMLIDAAEFADKIAPLTDEDLKVQFEGYAKSAQKVAELGTIDQSNPFGFGYLIPNRVRLQYLVISDEDVKKAVIAAKDAGIWEEDARVYFIKNKALFTVTPTTAPSTTQPAVEVPAETFEQVADKVYEQMRAPLIEATRTAVVTAINSRLATDYQKASKNFYATTQQVAETQFGASKYADEAYLATIAKEIQSQYRVPVTVVTTPGLMSADDFAKDTTLGLSYLGDNPARDNVSASQYIFASLKAFADPQAVKESSMITYDVYQPLKPVRNPVATLIPRVIEASAAHPPAKWEDVRAQLEKDTRRKMAFAKAIEAADAALKTANESGLGSVQGRKVSSTGKFQARDTKLPELPDADKFADQLTGPMFELLRDAKSTSDLPRRAVIKLQPEDKVAVVEVFSVDVENGIYNKANASFIRARVTDSLVQNYRRLNGSMALNNWFDKNAIAKRVNYVEPGGPATPASDKPKRPAPGSPFMPG